MKAPPKNYTPNAKKITIIKRPEPQKKYDVKKETLTYHEVE